ncbi:hypothetical protein BC833DRAFT_590364 [Globomyces pollinis-pini]|nr:hypothetical protein BC833DRAFT_590364 [Globomyces pollinis-pini]
MMECLLVLAPIAVSSPLLFGISLILIYVVRLKSVQNMLSTQQYCASTHSPVGFVLAVLLASVSSNFHAIYAKAIVECCLLELFRLLTKNQFHLSTLLLILFVYISSYFMYGYDSSVSTLLAPMFYCAISYLLSVTIQPSLTYAESTLISVLSSISLLDGVFMIYYSFSSNNPTQYHPIHILAFGLIWGMVLIGIISSYLLIDIRKLESISEQYFNYQIKSSVFYVVVVATVGLFIEPLMYYCIGEEPFLWTLNFIFDFNSVRMLIILYWIVLLNFVIWFAARWIDTQSNSSSQIDLRRKYFHLTVILLFIPGYLLDKSFLNLALCVALTAFILLEYIRSFKVWPFWSVLNQFFLPFLVERDQHGNAILSHIYLLIGCALPIWLSNITHPLSNSIPLCGTLALGVGDALASTVGKAYGKSKWPNSQKSIQGTIAFITGLFSSFFILNYFSGSNSSTLGTFIICISTGLLEAFSHQNDNLMIPLYLFSLLTLLG